MKTYEIQYKKPSTIHSGKVSKLVGLLFLILACFSTAGEMRHFGDWTKKEQLLLSGYIAAAYIDHKQTQWAMNNPCECYKEANSLVYGNSPSKDKSLLINGIVIAGMYYMVGKYPPDAMNTSLIIGNVGRWGVVAHNDSIGVSVSVAF